MSRHVEALELALECIEAWDRGCDRDHYWRDIEAAITAVKEALAEQPAQQEPVAYAVYHRMGGSKTLHWPEQHSEDGDHNEYRLVPLYTAPQPAQQEPVAYIHRQGNHWEVSERCLCDDEKTRGWTEEPLYTAPPASKPHGFAGVTAWIGDATVTRIVTQVQIQHERVAGQSMTQAARVCLDMLAAHGITGEKNGTR